MRFSFKKIDVRFLTSVAIFFLFILISKGVFNGFKYNKNKPGEIKKFQREAQAYFKAPEESKKEQELDIKELKTFDEDTTVQDEIENTYVAIIVDDLGINYRIAKELMAMNLDLTFSILPYKRYTEKIANSAKEKGIEIMLHLPMEPKSYPKDDPGVGALFVRMSDEKIRKNLYDMLDHDTGYFGVNNHMGSKFCEDYEKMSVVMSIIKEKGLYFVDSKTSVKSFGTKIANTYQIPNMTREIFLDNDKDEKKILSQLDKLIWISRKKGYAVAICHPYPETLSVLKKVECIFEENNVEIKKVSEILQLIDPFYEKGYGIYSYKEPKH